MVGSGLGQKSVGKVQASALMYSKLQWYFSIIGNTMPVYVIFICSLDSLLLAQIQVFECALHTWGTFSLDYYKTIYGINLEYE